MMWTFLKWIHKWNFKSTFSRHWGSGQSVAQFSFVGFVKKVFSSVSSRRRGTSASNVISSWENIAVDIDHEWPLRNVFQDVTTDNFNFKLPHNFSSHSSNKRKNRKNCMLSRIEKREKLTKQGREFSKFYFFSGEFSEAIEEQGEELQTVPSSE